MSLPGENCSSGCHEKSHLSWGDCQRSKNIAVLDPAGVVHRSRWDSDLSAYESARKQGIQPDSTNRVAVEAAVRMSEKTGEAYQA